MRSGEMSGIAWVFAFFLGLCAVLGAVLVCIAAQDSRKGISRATAHILEGL
jgi:hypothetical protein